MKRRSLIATLAVAALGLGVFAPVATAVGQDGPESGGEAAEVQHTASPASLDLEEPLVKQDDPVETDEGAADSASVQTPEEAQEQPSNNAPLEGEDAQSDEDNEAPAPDSSSEPAEDSSEDAEVALMRTGDAPVQLLRTGPAAMAAIPGLPLPLGAATIQPSTVYVRGASNTHDPFLMAGGVGLPDANTLLSLVPAGTLQALLKSAVCAQLPDLARPACDDAIEAIPLDDFTVDITPRYVTATLDQVDGTEFRSVDIGYESLDIGIGSLIGFAATSSDFGTAVDPLPGGNYRGDATLVADVELTGPTLTIPCIPNPLPWGGPCLIGPWEFPLEAELEDVAVATIANSPTLRVIDSPAVDASFTHSLGLTMNGAGYDAVLNGSIDTQYTAEEFNSLFETRAYLLNANDVQVRNVRLTPVDGQDGLQFTADFEGLPTGYYVGTVLISSDQLLPIPVTSDPMALQIIGANGQFSNSEVQLECPAEAGLIQ